MKREDGASRFTPWSVDRWGRLIAGANMLAFTLLGWAHHPLWLVGGAAGAANLVITSLTNRCLLHDLLIRLGAREREDLFFPGGRPRPAEEVSTPLRTGPSRRSQESEVHPRGRNGRTSRSSTREEAEVHC